MKSNRKKNYRIVINTLILSFILHACVPFPICEQSENCFYIGENKKIKIPLILPLTSKNISISQELQNSFEYAFQENEWISKIAEISIIDNFDDPEKNNEILLSFLESPESPIIFNFLLSENQLQENNFLLKSGKILFSNGTIQFNNKKANSFFPDNDSIFNQSISLLSDFTFAEKTLIFADYRTIEHDISDLCKQVEKSCYQFDATNDGLSNEITSRNPVPIVLIAHKPEILKWLRKHNTIKNPIIIIDESFSNPKDFLSLNNDLYWIGPDIWVDNSLSDMSSEYKWNLFETIIAYKQFENVFKALESQLSKPQNGFRNLDKDLFLEQYIEYNNEQGFKFHIYQLHNRQFIMLKEPAQG